MPTAFDQTIRVKIVQPGMTGYNGYIRGTRFVDGISHEEMPIRDALRLAASCAVEDMNGNQLSPNTYVFEDADKISADDVMPKVEAIVEEAIQPEPEDEVIDFYEPGEEHAEAKKWDLQALEAIADAEGISGLREIGEEFGVKERSIDGLIKEIMKAQGGDKLAGED